MATSGQENFRPLFQMSFCVLTQKRMLLHNSGKSNKRINYLAIEH